jgi:hypothetical protein
MKADIKKWLLVCSFIAFIFPCFSSASATYDYDEIQIRPENRELCDNIDQYLSDCRMDANNVFSKATIRCSYYMYSIYAANLVSIVLIAFFARRAPNLKKRLFVALIPFLYINIFITSIGGSSSCRRGEEVVRNTNYDICANNMEKIKSMCNIKEMELK